ncbi:MAG: hypothetical protein KJS64_07045, partial [Acidobacteria bacterium]|nr:hypothetical protein [Acidobacteriota bacterium]
MAHSRSSLEGKDIDELRDLVKAAGIKTSGRSGREHLIDLLTNGGSTSSDSPAQERAPRVRRTVSSEDFEGLEDTPSTTSSSESTDTESDGASERRSDRGSG